MTPTIRRLTVADIPAGMALKEQNGWNTTVEDWRRQLDLEPDGCFAAELDGQMIGTACACVFDTVAWVNLVLVDQAYRGRGLGTTLMRTVLAWLDERRIPSIRLDATPLGRPIYEKLGFAAEYELTRHAGPLPLAAAAGNADHVDHANFPHDVSAVAELDRRITGTNRAKLIRYHFERHDCFVVREQRSIIGYAGLRPGSRMRHIGPCLGPASACKAMIGLIARNLNGESVYMDVPVENVPANVVAKSCGLMPQRQLTRMGRGVRVVEKLDELWCSFGPEKG